MPDKKPTDNEIIKALELCTSEHLGCEDGCPYTNSVQCRYDLLKATLDLINRLQAEIERLKEEKETLKSLLDSNQERYFKISNLCHKYRNKLKTAKAEAYKEFWNSRPERLNEQCEGREEYNKGWNACLDEFWEIRNNLLKELVGEDNAR